MVKTRIVVRKLYEIQILVVHKTVLLEHSNTHLLPNGYGSFQRKNNRMFL